MPQNTVASTDSGEAQVAEAHALQDAAMDQLRDALLAANEEDLRLHRQALKTITAMRKDLERVKRSLRALGTARS